MGFSRRGFVGRQAAARRGSVPPAGRSSLPQEISEPLEVLLGDLRPTDLRGEPVSEGRVDYLPRVRVFGDVVDVEPEPAVRAEHLAGEVDVPVGARVVGVHVVRLRTRFRR